AVGDHAARGVHGHDRPVAHNEVDCARLRGGKRGGEGEEEEEEEDRHRYRFLASKSSGSSSDMPRVRDRPCRLTTCTHRPPPYSQSTCRQAPQGAVRRGESATTATASNSRKPSETALKMATR